MGEPVSYSFFTRQETLRPNIVVPQVAAGEPRFETNVADLHKPKDAPRVWPSFRPPGYVQGYRLPRPIDPVPPISGSQIFYQ
jgi:hypothetical protein